MDVVLDTLSYMSKLGRMNQLVYRKIEPYLGKRILEAGCGNGNLTAFFIDRELVVAVDNDDAMLREFRVRFSGYSNVKIHKYDLTDTRIRETAQYQVDTVICSNVLEHIADEQAVMDNFKSVLACGNVIIVVPAFEFLYSPLDKAAGHYRRYSIKRLREIVERNGFIVVKDMYANLFGIAGWFINGKLLRKKRLSNKLLSLFNFLTPIFEWIENVIRLPAGLSIILICRKKPVK